MRLTLNTSPTGLQVTYGGALATAPATFTTVVGGTRTIGAPSPQGGLAFKQWSDGGAQQHNIVIGSVDMTDTATFADATPPVVTSTSPSNGAVGVA